MPSDDNNQPPAPQPPAPPAPPPEEALTLTPAQMSERMARHHRSQMKQLFGTDDASVIAEQLKQAEKYRKEEEERARAQMTELERVKADAAQALARAKELEQERDAKAFEAQVSREAAKLGIKNLDYAMFSVIRATEGLPDDQQLDLGSFLAEQLKDPSTRAAFGVLTAAPPVPDPVNTSPTGNQPPPPPPGIPPAPPPDAFKLDDKAWAARRQALGIR